MEGGFDSTTGRDALVALNVRVRASAAQLGSTASSVWEFACECGSCTCTVVLTPAEYDALREAERRVLADGH